jgi:ABC-type antimicrobial peptide transport system permease subunit
LESAALSSPLRLALDATLAVGFTAALTMAVIGFALHFVSAARGRLSEYAILQANGLSASLVRRSLMIEEGVLLLHSLVCGVLLGLVFSYAVLPAMHVGDTTSDLVPPTLVTIDPPVVGAALLAVVAGAALVSVLVGRAAARFDLLGQLREIG